MMLVPGDKFKAAERFAVGDQGLPVVSNTCHVKVTFPHETGTSYVLRTVLILRLNCCRAAVLLLVHAPPASLLLQSVREGAVCIGLP